MSLCPACRKIGVTNLTRELGELPPWWGQARSKSTKPRGMVHLDDAQHLIASAATGCPFCQLIVSAVLQHNSAANISGCSIQTPEGQIERDVRQLEDTLAPQPIYLQTTYDPVKPSFPEHGTSRSWHIRGLKALVPVDHGLLVGRIRLFAAHDSPEGASCDIIGRPPLPSSDSPEAFYLIERWLSTCLAKHEACRESVSSTAIDESLPPILPTRVIHVGDSDDASTLRLLQTKGQRGHYVALSHCWGPPDHRPLMTTRSSLTDHLAGISWETLPQTYRDAISATGHLHFEYIWIDSLCIIQDSHDDWLSESQCMGDVYQHARLTIAASHAADSGQPCFFTRPPAPTVVELPHMGPDGQTESSMFASVLFSDYDSISPESGSLADRAWASASFHSTARNTRWKVIVEKYSTRQLTQRTDRLIALEGIRSEMVKKRANDEYCFGLWKNSMPDQLLWYCLKPAERSRCELDLPTWTWASTFDRVRFFDIKGAKNACDGFRFDETTKTLTFRSATRDISGLALLADLAEVAEDDVFADAPRDIVAADILYALQDDANQHIGWCALDEPELPNVDLFCLQLMSKTTKPKPASGVEMAYRNWVLLLREALPISKYSNALVWAGSSRPLRGSRTAAVRIFEFDDPSTTHVFKLRCPSGLLARLATIVDSRTTCSSTDFSRI
ncbi:HET-domain-containing protein [Setomelanomma holmii]|uniref:HET-domain-containing protein n=1 Tax=Setomelanomma holmii TaxID=210430 RepID=A0A9P4HEC9_9PLEO|nr:HET-domain-containing protein [Setomelanomma holmii]